VGNISFDLRPGLRENYSRRMSFSHRGRLAFAASLAITTGFVLFLAVHFNSRLLGFVATLLAMTAALATPNIWPRWLTLHRHWALALIMFALVLDLHQAWLKNDTFWEICGLATVLFGGVQYVRRFRVQRQFRDAEHWPVTKGGFSGNYEDGDSRVIYYGYQVNGSYYSGFVAAGSTLSKGLKSRLDALRGKPALIRYKPDQPEISTLFKSDQIESFV